MLILGIESTAKAASVALWRDGEMLALNYQRTALTHSRTLLPMAESMLANTGLTPEEIDCVAVAQGPGSFTGVRIGVATAKGLCWAAEKPAVGVSTLEAMAHLALGAAEGELICPAMDARRQQVYAALFEKKGGLTRLCPDRAVDAGELAEEIRRSGRRVYVLGDGWAVMEEALKKAGVECAVAAEALRYQNAWGVCCAAAGKNPQSAETLLPIYLRLSQAERERQERLSKENT
ncbi:MAG: tRNA (adenosine(37)-N6)-threonylcarbamoyltransferase complex dimerization subunit type 1 TsaB [Oscillospiraceae bacterium]|nr:tRNA (adenosine(37)-N6)-threonylcarbamoyltransferase complex dimerization subunit type 1 TsaB [bacterium]MDY5100566.1 tRNA (adenosine(37)-N6)-threonylcarbamoyltransferase complex dimerization subunit type 1 TsaB [Oscillospiraceae bacterium]